MNRLESYKHYFLRAVRKIFLRPCPMLCALGVLLHTIACGDELEDAIVNPVIEASRGPLFVSLGSYCVTAGMIRHFGKREAAFPFDWMLTFDEEGLIQLLNNNFQDFLNIDYLGKHPINGCTLVQYLYRMEFTHYWIPDFWQNPALCQEEMEKFHIQCQRRVQRFQQLAHYQGTVVFIRAQTSVKKKAEACWFDLPVCGDDKDSALKLYGALKNLFPSLDCKLLVVNQVEGENRWETFGNITLCYFLNVDEHCHWESVFTSERLYR